MMAEIGDRIEELEKRVEELENQVAKGTITPSTSDLEEFLDTVSPATHFERAATIGFYLIHERGMESFTVGDVKEAYISCRVPKPANISDILAGAEEKGWLMRTGTEGQKQLWTITKEGDDAVNRGFEQ